MTNKIILFNLLNRILEKRIDSLEKRFINEAKEIEKVNKDITLITKTVNNWKSKLIPKKEEEMKIGFKGVKMIDKQTQTYLQKEEEKRNINNKNLVIDMKPNLNKTVFLPIIKSTNELSPSRFTKNKTHTWKRNMNPGNKRQPTIFDKGIRNNKKNTIKKKVKEEIIIPRKSNSKIIEENFERILSFLDIKEKYALSKLTKDTVCTFLEYFKTIQYKSKIKEIQKETKRLLKIYSQEDLEEDIEPFTLVSGGLQAVTLLNDPFYLQIFNSSTPTPSNDYLIIYRLLFQFLNHRHPFHKIQDPTKFWLKIGTFFIRNSNEKLGNLLRYEFRHLNLSDENIQTIIKMSEPYTDILTPTYYSKECPTTGLFAFLIKEALEYIGAINTENTQPSRLYRNIQYRISKEQSKIDAVDLFIKRLKQ